MLEQSGARLLDSGARLQESAAELLESKARLQESEAKLPKPGANLEGPGARLQGSVAKLLGFEQNPKTFPCRQPLHDQKERFATEAAILGAGIQPGTKGPRIQGPRTKE